MIDNILREFPLKKHPIFKNLKKEILKLQFKNNLLQILEDYAFFIYPKTISFSFEKYCFSNIYLIDFVNNFEDKVFLREGESETTLSISKLFFLDFFSNLLFVFKKIQFNPILVFDFSDSLIFDQTLINDISSLRKDHGLNLKLIAIGNANLKKYIITSDSDVVVYFSKEDTLKYIDDYVCQDGNYLKISFSGIITLKKIEDIFGLLNLNNEFKSKYMVLFDFTNAITISTFSIFQLNIFIHSLAHQFGVLCKFDKTNEKILNQFTIFRVFKINKSLLINDHVEKKINGKIKLGVFIFDNIVFADTINKFDDFIAYVVRNTKNYLESYVSKKYDFPGATKKEITYRLAIKNVISWIISELAENALIHSEGIGYIGARVVNDLLLLFIGDSGIGLKEGILKNYDLDDTIYDDKSAILYTFQLTKYHAKRKKLEPLEYGSGRGLRDTLSNIFLCKGKFILRTGAAIGSFINPVSKGYIPTKIINSNLNIIGTQYMIIIPLTESAERNLPNKTDDFLSIGG
jgi:hypothetical protein